MKRTSMAVPALVALLAAVSSATAFAQSATPASPAPASAAAPAKSEASTKKATTTTTSKSSTHATTASHSSSSTKATTTPMLDINSASKQELAKLPTIGDALADKIIAARPYKSRKELVSKGVLTQKEYDKVHTHLTAKQN